MISFKARHAVATRATCQSLSNAPKRIAAPLSISFKHQYVAVTDCQADLDGGVELRALAMDLS
jgi:hypothetical protein